MNNSIIIPFVLADSLAGNDEYWAHIEQVLPESDVATLDKVAELVDNLFSTDPCKELGIGEEEENPLLDDPDSPLYVPETSSSAANSFTGTFEVGQKWFANIVAQRLAAKLAVSTNL